ncbi:MAG: hypothetical protein AAB658_06470 [Chloroflexota bacterium]
MPKSTLRLIALALTLAACTAPAPTAAVPIATPTAIAITSTDAPPTTNAPPSATPLAPASTATTPSISFTQVARLGNGIINYMALSPDGKALAVASSVGVWLYDALTLQAQRLLEKNLVSLTAWSPDGTKLAIVVTDSTDYSQSLEIWDVNTWQALITLPRKTDEGIFNIAWFPDSTQLAVAASGEFQIWDISTGQSTSLPNFNGVAFDAAWSPDGSQLAIGSNQSDGVLLYDLTTGQQRLFLTDQIGGPKLLAWSPDGKWLASVHDDGWLRIWDVASGAEQRKYPSIGFTSIDSLAWSLDSNTIAAGYRDNIIRLWSFDAEEPVLLTDSWWSIHSLAFSPDGKLLYSAGHDNILRVWDVASATLAKSAVDFGDAVEQLTWSAMDGKPTLVTTGRDPFYVIRVWDPATGQLKQILNRYVMNGLGVRNSENGWQFLSQMVEGSSDLLLWNAQDESQPLVFKGRTGEVSSAAWSENGKWIATGGADNAVRVWDAVTGEKVGELSGFVGFFVNNLCWLNNDSRLTWNDENGVIKSWQWQAGQTGPTQLLDANTGAYPTAFAWSPDESAVAVSYDGGSIRIWAVQNGKPIADLPGTPPDRAYVLAWSPDGTLLATANTADFAVRVWDVTAQQVVATLTGHTDYVNALAWSPDGQLLASGSSDGTVRLWQLSR